MRNQQLKNRSTPMLRDAQSLTGTASSINTDVSALIHNIDSSMQEADKLISTLDNANQS